MIRLSLLVFTVIACALLSSARARAATEYCPAAARVTPPASAAQSGASAYDMELWSQVPHSLSGQLQFFTPKGWFAVDLAGMQLQRTQDVWRMSGFAYPVNAWDADLHVTFPSGVDVDAVVLAAQPGARCLAYAKPQKADAGAPVWHVTSQSPPPMISMNARAIAAPGRTDCAQPFEEASVVEPVPPQFPQRFLDRGFDRSGTLLSVAIDARGALQDAWFLSPSGFYEIDESAMRAVRLSGYRAGTLFCRPAPGVYTYEETFRAN